jgi:hypothetical protein
VRGEAIFDDCIAGFSYIMFSPCIDWKYVIVTRHLQDWKPLRYGITLCVTWVLPTDSSNWGISLLSTTYKCLCNILLSRSTPYAEDVTAGHE